MPEPADVLLTMDEVAARLRFTVRHIQKLRKRGAQHGPHVGRARNWRRERVHTRHLRSGGQKQALPGGRAPEATCPRAAGWAASGAAGGELRGGSGAGDERGTSRVGG